MSDNDKLLEHLLSEVSSMRSELHDGMAGVQRDLGDLCARMEIVEKQIVGKHAPRSENTSELARVKLAEAEAKKSWAETAKAWLGPIGALLAAIAAWLSHFKGDSQ